MSDTDFDALARDYVPGATPTGVIRRSMMDAVDKQPDTEAKLQALAKQYRMPIDSVRLDQPFIEKKAKLDALDYDALARQLPKTAAHLSDPSKAALAHDDVDNLSLIETLVNSFKRGVPGLEQIGSATSFRSNASTTAQIDSAEKLLGAGRSNLTLEEDPLGIEYMAPAERAEFRASLGRAVTGNVATIARTQAERAAIPQPAVVDRVMQAKSFAEGLRAIAEDPARFIAAIGPESLVTSMPGLLAAIPAGLAAGPAGAGAAMGAGSFASDYGSTIISALGKEGVDVSNPAAIEAAAKNPELMRRVAAQAMAHAGVVGLIDAGSAGLAGRMLLPGAMASRMASAPVARELANVAVQMPVQGALGAAGEVGGSIVAGQDIAPGEVLAEFFGEAFGTPAEIASVSARGVMKRMAQAREATANAEALTQLSAAVEASKVRGRSTEDFAAFMQSATQDGPVADIYIDPAALAQSGVDIEALVAVSPSVAKQLADAQVSGADIRIPVAEFGTSIAGTDFAQSLIPHLRTEVDGMSQAEAEVFMQESGEELRAGVEQSLIRQDSTEAVRASRDVVQADMLAKLTAANVEPDAAKLYAALAAARYGTLAHQLGVTPEEAYAQHPLNVRGAQVADVKPGDLEQPAPKPVEPVKPSPEAIELRKRESVLKSLMECLA